MRLLRSIALAHAGLAMTSLNYLIYPCIQKRTNLKLNPIIKYWK